MTTERLQKLLARAGLGSRRRCEDIIRQGRVSVNGKTARLGDSADPEADVILVDGERLRLSQSFTYVMVNKPRGVITAAAAQRQEGRPTVRDLVDLPGRIVPVGRLDADSEGLVILTDDGELVNRLTHPRFEHPKTYRVQVAGRPSEETLAAWRRGVVLDDGRTLPCAVRVLNVEKGTTWLEMVLREGRKRQIRRMGAVMGHPVRRIIRTHIGPLALEDLKPGEWRRLTPDEVARLRAPSPRPARKRR